MLLMALHYYIIECMLYQGYIGYIVLSNDIHLDRFEERE